MRAMRRVPSLYRRGQQYTRHDHKRCSAVPGAPSLGLLPASLSWLSRCRMGFSPCPNPVVECSPFRSHVHASLWDVWSRKLAAAIQGTLSIGWGISTRRQCWDLGNPQEDRPARKSRTDQGRQHAWCSDDVLAVVPRCRPHFRPVFSSLGLLSGPGWRLPRWHIS